MHFQSQAYITELSLKAAGVLHKENCIIAEWTDVSFTYKTSLFINISQLWINSLSLQLDLF